MDHQLEKPLRSLDQAFEDALAQLYRTARTDPRRRDVETRVERLRREIRLREARAAERTRG
jgi:hypothetical protein